jgi:hypothetical protein
MKKCVLTLLALMLVVAGVLSLVNSSEARTANDDNGKVYILAVDALSVLDIDPLVTPNLHYLSEKGAVGLSSNRTLRGTNTFDSSLTIGAGNLARAYSHGIMAYNSSETVDSRNQSAARLYKNLTGWNPDNSACLLVNLPEVLAGLDKENVDSVPGAMGEVLKNNGRKVCVLGNGDINGITSRASVAIGMDATGKVPLGDVGPNTVHQTLDGYLGWETNYDYLQQEVRRYKSEADVIILELSDLARIDKADIGFPDIMKQQRATYLKRLDQFAGEIIRLMDPNNDLMLIIAPSPSLEQISLKNNFTPVLAYGKNISHGYLTSAATRRSYIISSNDIAPTVLNFFHIKPVPGMIGQPIQNVKVGSDPLQDAQKLSLSTATVNRLRVPLVKGYIVWLIIVILLSVIAIFWIPKLIKAVEPMVVSLVAVPMVLLPLGRLSFATDWAYIITALVAVIVLTALAIVIARFNYGKAFIIIAVITAAAIDYDLLTGFSMIQSSVLGYDPMAGARYYGIGNEYMGILLGSIIILGAVMYERFQTKWVLALVALVFLMHCYFIAGPTLGAQSDGVLTAPVAFLVTIALLGNIKIKPRVLLGILGIVAASVLGLTIYDMNRPAEMQTHIGRAANQIAAGGWQAGLTIIARKLGMNAKLIRYTIWSRVFMVMLAVLALLIYRPVGAMGKIMMRRPYIVKGFAGIVTGAIVGLIVNDSGIVAAATTSIYMVVPLLLLMMDLQKSPVQDCN